jgi:hypothetical protein
MAPRFVQWLMLMPDKSDVEGIRHKIYVRSEKAKEKN